MSLPFHSLVLLVCKISLGPKFNLKIYILFFLVVYITEAQNVKFLYMFYKNLMYKIETLIKKKANLDFESPILFSCLYCMCFGGSWQYLTLSMKFFSHGVIL